VILNPRPADVDESDGFSADTLAPEWLAVRRYPAEVSTVGEGRLVLHGDGSTLDDLRPVFVGRRQRHEAAEFSVTVDAGSGTGGLTVRFDELHHYEIEVSAGVLKARAVIAGIRQEWTGPEVAGSVRLHLDCVPATGSTLLELLTSDHIRLGSTDPATGKRIDLAEVDGRYLSQETAASFTGRVVGLYAVDGDVAFSEFRYHGAGGQS
jgi:hypothetical protein